jgi:hypothetical protein
MQLGDQLAEIAKENGNSSPNIRDQNKTRMPGSGWLTAVGSMETL